MKLVHMNIETHIIFKEGIVNVINIENKRFFRQVVTSLKEQIGGNDGPFVLSDGDKILNLKKTMILNDKPFDILLNQKAYVSKLESMLIEYANGEDFYVRTKEIESLINNYISRLIDDEELIFYAANSIEAKDLIKIGKISYEYEGKDLLEQYIDLIKIIARTTVVKCIGFIGLKQVFDNDELLEIYQTANYEKIHILLIESINNMTCKLSIENWLIVDEDLCEI